MAFTAGNVALPASGGTPVLVYQTPDSVPTDVNLVVDGYEAWILDSASQTPSTGCLLNSSTISLTGLIGSVYAVGYNVAGTIYYTASNIL